MLTTTLFVLLLSSTSQVYKCDFNGTTVYSQQPCGDDAELVQIKTTSVGGNTISTLAPSKPAMSEYDQISRNIDKRNLNIELVKLNAQKERTIKRRNADLAALRAKQSRARNNLAGATFLESISTEMNAVVSRYDADIAELNRQIDQMTDRIRKL